MAMQHGDSSKINRLENAERLSYIQRRKEAEEKEALQLLLKKKNEQIDKLRKHFETRQSLSKKKFYDIVGGMYENNIYGI